MRWALVLWAAYARLRSGMIPKYAHQTAQVGLTLGAEEATRRSHAEQSKLQQLIGALNVDLEAARMRNAELKDSVSAAKPPEPTAPPPTQAPLLPNFAPASVPFMVREMAEARLRVAIPAYVHSLVNASAAQAAADAAGLGAQVGEGIAQVAAPQAAEAAIAQLVRIACQVAAGPAEQAAYQAAKAATNLTSAGELAASSTGSIEGGCTQELTMVAADIVLQAANASQAAAMNASHAAASAAATLLVAPAAEHAETAETDRLFTHVQPEFLATAAATALASYKEAEASGVKDAEVAVEAETLRRTMTAAEMIVDAAKHLAGEAGKSALVADLHIHDRLQEEVDASHPGAFRSVVEDLVLP